MRVGLFDHFGWGVAVTASADHAVVDRRRIELVEPGVTPAPIHYDAPSLSVAETESLVRTVRASIARAATAAFDALAADLPGPVDAVLLRTWPDDFPADIETQRRTPYESRADAIMYRQEIAAVAAARGWDVVRYDAKTVLPEATRVLADRADDVLLGPRKALGPPWTKDHRIALAATIVG